MLAAQNPIVPIPDEIGVIPDDFDLSTITTADLIFAGASVVAGFVLGTVLGGLDDKWSSLSGQ